MSVGVDEAQSQPLPDAVVTPAPAQARGRASPRWFGAARSTRTRILAAYVVLLALSVIIGLVALREVLLISLNDRIQEDLEQEVNEVDVLVTDGNDPQTGQRFDSLERVFEVFLFRNIPGNGEALLTFVEGRPTDRDVEQFPLEEFPAERLAEWQRLSEPSGGISRVVVASYGTELGDVHYHAARVRLGDEVGSFVVAILPASELVVIEELQTYGLLAALGVLLISSIAAYLLAGRVLRPVQELTDTARTISQSDLTRRISASGGDEASEMARSFNAMLDRLEAVMRSQREFVHDASHELRDPLTIVGGHLELLSEAPEEREATIALVTDELERMGRIVDDLQLLADAQQPDFLRPTWIDLEPFTNELLAKAAAMASSDLGDRCGRRRRGARRPPPPDRGGHKSRPQRRAAHGRARHHRRRLVGCRRRAPALGPRHRLRHRRGGAGPCLRSVPARAERPPPLPRQRPRAGDRAHHRRGARRPHRARQPARPGLDLHDGAARPWRERRDDPHPDRRGRRPHQLVHRQGPAGQRLLDPHRQRRRGGRAVRPDRRVRPDHPRHGAARSATASRC